MKKKVKKKEEYEGKMRAEGKMQNAKCNNFVSA